MEVRSVEAIITALNAAKVQYLVVGGLATAVMSSLELRNLNGSTYTAIFRKP